MRRLLTALLFLACATPVLSCRGQVPDQDRIPSRRDAPRGWTRSAPVDSTFAKLIEQLSEPGGYFDTDNLISNEQSYLHVMGKLREMRIRGGAYIGVGPDQNFSYIAQIRPDVAFIIDIRRDNLLQHLWFKALFQLADTRAQYLALMFGKPSPTGRRWERATIEQLLDYVDAAPTRTDVVDATRAAIHAKLRGFGVPLSDADLASIDRIHSIFISAGPDLRFTSHNRPPRAYYPTYRKLLQERDLTERQTSYLAEEASFRIVKELQQRDRILPIVGDLAGPHALKAIGRYLAERGKTVSTFYTSNVEFYLLRQNSFATFADNVRHLPHDERSLIIRSYFGGWYRRQHPQAVAGYFSSQLLQQIAGFLADYDGGGYTSYFDLVTRGSQDLR